MASSLAFYENVDGYISIWLYVNYFVPGRLKLHTELYEIDANILKKIVDHSAYEPELAEVLEGSRRWLTEGPRRWLQKSEMPFPGYCRSPASGKCLPVLCNCKKLEEIWEKIKNRLPYAENK
ncbi:uncharacterized protein LOC116771857 [Danaus plexippus]|uniref:uncharacterized protein LOC116771857 n=1 Tax=Danaus plexippus TaxID=13037 RepID=UPI002AB1E855|nr:uncharacterized protein LOC116771857 [Danaus plexippus]